MSDLVSTARPATAREINLIDEITHLNKRIAELEADCDRLRKRHEKLEGQRETARELTLALEQRADKAEATIKRVEVAEKEIREYPPNEGASDFWGGYYQGKQDAVKQLRLALWSGCNVNDEVTGPNIYTSSPEALKEL